MVHYLYVNLQTYIPNQMFHILSSDLKIVT